MSLSKKAIDEFKEIYQKEYKKELTDAEASEAANNLVGFTKFICSLGGTRASKYLLPSQTSDN